MCSGIEAASVAFAPLNWEAAWLAEVDVAASQVLAYRLGATAPQHPLPGTEKAISRLKWGDQIVNYGDMTVLAALVRARKVVAPDILCGGTPCQSFSIAGLRGGLDDPRGQLTMAFIDLANAIDEIRAEDGLPPVIIIWENVPGVLSHADNPLGCFLAGLAGDDDALEPGPRPGSARSSAYWSWDKVSGVHRAKWPDAGAAVGPQRAVGWRIGNAEYFGLAQRRRRIFVVASAREGFDPAAILLEFEGVRRDSAPSREAREDVTHAIAPCLTGSGRGVERTGDPRGQDPVVACRRGAWETSSDVDGRYAAHTPGIGSGRPDRSARVVPTLDASYARLQGCSGQDLNHGHLVVEAFGGNNQSGPIDVSTACNAHGGPHGGPHGRLDFESETFIVQSVALRGRDGGATAELGDETAYALRAAAGGGSDPYVLAPLTTFQTRGSNIDIDDHVTGTIGSNCDRASGSAPMIAFSCKDYGADATEDIAPTMRAMGHSDSHANAGGQLAVCVHGTQDPDVNIDFAHTLGRNSGQENALFGATMAVRRLMPIECHRLQGFPDNWCAVPTGPKGDKITADGPQYKQLGNSWAVNHARWVGWRVACWVAANPSRPVIQMEFDESLLIWAMVD